MVYHHNYCLIVEGNFHSTCYKILMEVHRTNTTVYHPTDVPEEKATTDVLVEEEFTIDILVEEFISSIQSTATSKAKASGKGGGSERKWKDHV